MGTPLFIGLLLHFVGDYLLQNDWIADRKTRQTIPCLIHCALYTLPFSVLLYNTPGMWIIFISHFLIDRFRLAVLWIRLINWNWHGTNSGFTDSKPAYLSVWLLIITDNTFHVLFNSLAIILAYL